MKSLGCERLDFYVTGFGQRSIVPAFKDRVGNLEIRNSARDSGSTVMKHWDSYFSVQ